MTKKTPDPFSSPRGLHTLRGTKEKMCERACEGAIFKETCVTNCAGRLSDSDAYLEWYDMEKNDMEWLGEISECPSKIRICPTTGEPINCNNGGWGGIGKANQSYHPGAAWEMRSSNHYGPAQQCTYDENGDLITSGLGAGTPDREAASFLNGIWGHHYSHDVDPFDTAWDMDGGVMGPYLKRYFEVRPPSQGGGSCYE